MSNFELPPLLGFDALQKPRFPMPMTDAMGQGVQDPERIGRARTAIAGGEGGSPARFDGVLADSLAKVQSLQDDVRQKTRGLAMGEDVELHDVLLASGKSEVAFNLLLEVRNKLVDAWEKLSRSAV